jgi:hypothetical protein
MVQESMYPLLSVSLPVKQEMDKVCLESARNITADWPHCRLLFKEVQLRAQPSKYVV